LSIHFTSSDESDALNQRYWAKIETHWSVAGGVADLGKPQQKIFFATIA